MITETSYLKLSPNELNYAYLSSYAAIWGWGTLER